MRFPALRSKNFVLYTAGNFFALNGIWINRVVIGWLGWELTHLASWVGLLSFLLFAPTIISGPLFGVLVDRIDLRRAAMVSQSVLTMGLTALLVLYLTDGLTIWMLGLVALLIGVTTSADRTIRMVLVPSIIDRSALANAVAIHGINFNTARLLGPAIGGVLIDQIGTGLTIVVNLVLVAPFFIVLVLLDIQGRGSLREGDRRFFAELLDGARHVARHPLIREAMMLTAIFSFTVRGILEILPAVADGEFHRGAQGLGQMLAASGAGALVAAVFIAVRRSGVSVAGIPLHIQVTMSVGLLAAFALGLTENWIVALLLVFILGFCLTTNGIDLQAAIQLALDDAYRGRVMSLWTTVVIGGAATSAIVCGNVADLFGMSVALVATATAGIVLLAVNRLLTWRARRSGHSST